MNIFVLDEDPLESGRILLRVSPARARKQVLEFLQAAAVIAEEIENTGTPVGLIYTVAGKPYKTQLAKRFPKPLMKWLKVGKNFRWAWYMCVFCAGNKRSSLDLNYPHLKRVLNYLEAHDEIQFVNYAKSGAKGQDFTHIENVTEAYQKYLEAQGVIFEEVKR